MKRGSALRPFPVYFQSDLAYPKPRNGNEQDGNARLLPICPHVSSDGSFERLLCPDNRNLNYLSLVF